MSMPPQKSLFYLDTSGLNFLADNVKDFDFLSEMKDHLGFELYLSPITLWEVLLNSDDARRDYLIYWGQFNCSENLVKSPTEIIFDYLKAKCPQKSRKSFFDSPFTDQQIGTTWKNIHGKIDRTIPIDIDALKERSETIRQLSKQLKVIVNDMCSGERPNDPFHKIMNKALKRLKWSKHLNLEDERLFKISLILLFFIICIGFELENSAVRDFWGKYGTDNPLKRLNRLIKKQPQILIRGPIVEMAKMAEIQISADNSNSRGLIHDCFHTIYCYYADNLITGDKHFQSLRDNTPHPTFERIIMTEQIEKTWEATMKMLKDKNVF